MKLFWLSLSVAHAFSSWRTAPIDYSAANEYVEAHYGEPSYFDANVRDEPIYNARLGVNGQPASMETCGFTVVPDFESDCHDFGDLPSVERDYLPAVGSAMKAAFADRSIKHLVFWHPVYRSLQFEQVRPEDPTETPTSNFVTTVHIDVDVNAYDRVEDFCALIEKNQLGDEQVNLVDLIRQGHGFAIVNAWKNVGDQPVTSLALYSVSPGFPQKPKDGAWYVFPRIQPSELLLFCQYDRDMARPSDAWHCALPGDTDRESFDLRCLVIFDEIVPPARNRFKDTGAKLTLEESACFCSEQHRRRSDKLDGVENDTTTD